MNKLNKEDKQRNNEIVPIAREILQKIVDAELPLGDLHAHDTAKFDNLAKEIRNLLVDKNICYFDKELLVQLVRQPVEMVMGKVMTALGWDFNRALEKAFEVKILQEIRMNDLDRVIKTKKADA